MRVHSLILGAALAATATSTAAYDPIVTQRGWSRIALFEDGDCAGEVGTNGKFAVLTVVGFEPGETARLTLTNGDMMPIDRTVRINRQGGWQEYYIPFRFGTQGGEVTALITGSRCRIPLSFAWSRGDAPAAGSLRADPWR